MYVNLLLLAPFFFVLLHHPNAPVLVVNSPAQGVGFPKKKLINAMAYGYHLNQQTNFITSVLEKVSINASLDLRVRLAMRWKTERTFTCIVARVLCHRPLAGTAHLTLHQCSQIDSQKKKKFTDPFQIICFHYKKCGDL